MELKDIKTILNDALQAPKDDVLRAKYGEAIADYLKDKADDFKGFADLLIHSKR